VIIATAGSGKTTRIVDEALKADKQRVLITTYTNENLEQIQDVIIGKVPNLSRYNEDELPHVGVKAAMFSFTRLRGADPVLGVEMASTGEVGCISQNFEEALLLALEASKVSVPQKGILVSAGSEREKINFLESARIFAAIGLKIYATEGTAKFLKERGYACEAVAWPGAATRDVISVIRSHEVDLVVNIPKSSHIRELTNGAKIRQAAVQFDCPLITDMEKLNAFACAIEYCGKDFARTHVPIQLPPYRS
jgi:carbamoyl-phosphate synthase large subunit